MAAVKRKVLPARFYRTATGAEPVRKWLKALSRESLPVGVVKAIAQHRKWSHTYNVRLALVRHPGATLSTILAYLPELTVSDLRELAAPGIVSENLRKYLLAEIQQRIRKSEKSAQVFDTTGEPGASNSD